MEKNLTNISIVALICGTVLLVATFIWPTPYLYMKVTRPVYRGLGYQESDQVWRINRLTGFAIDLEVTVTD
jgi:hypothetical protein